MLKVEAYPRRPSQDIPTLPNGLWSLWKIMQEFDAGDWFLVTQLTTTILIEAKKREFNERLNEPQKLVEHLGSIADACHKAGLPVAAALTLQQQRHVSTEENPSHIIWSFGDAVGCCETILSTIQAELDSKLFFRLAEDTAKYFRDKLLFGGSVDACFPAAITDIEEAGKCLALGRGTASVFHLMRVTELGLKMIANELGIPYAPSWESYINQIQKKMAEKHKLKTKAWRRLEPLYRELLGDLQAVKIAWRNPTMHIVRNYTLEEAEDVFRTTKTFMKRIADHLMALSEEKARKQAARMYS